jgi:ankyrin repeat protein
MTFAEAHTVIKKGDLISLRRALDEGLDPDLANQFSWTLLMLAAMQGNTRIAELLVARRAHVNKTNDFGETALSLAAHFGHISFIKVLLIHGASPSCHPHGHPLEDWLKVASGLPKDRIAAILKLINGTQLTP